MFRAYSSQVTSTSGSSSSFHDETKPPSEEGGDLKRSRGATGKLLLRIEDLDFLRCKNHFLNEMLEDLRWFGIRWTEPLPSECGQARTEQDTREIMHVVKQSERLSEYRSVWRRLFQRGYVYPSPHSRRDLERAISAPHEGDTEAIFPVQFRPEYIQAAPYACDSNQHFPDDIRNLEEPTNVNWRFKVPDGRKIEFTDARCGPQSFGCGTDFGDFLIWRGSDNIPSYEFAVVVDDMAMGVTEIVRGEDLLVSTARQILLYEALMSCEDSGMRNIPSFYHCPLARDENGRRLAKRCPGHTLRSLRLERGYTPARIVDEFFEPEAKQMFHQLQQMVTESS